MKTVALPEVIAGLCSSVECNRDVAERFVVELERIVTEALISAGNVDIPGIGSFRMIDVGGELLVEFAPTEQLTAVVNAPFSMFEPIELDDDVTGEMLEQAGNEAPEVITEAILEAESEISAEPAKDNSAEDEPEYEPGQTAIKSPIEDSGTCEEEIKAQEEPEEEEEETVEKAVEEESVEVTGKELSQEDVSDNSEIVEECSVVSPVVTREHIIERERIVEPNGGAESNEAGRHRLLMILCTLGGILVGLLLGYLLFARMNFTGVKNVNISTEDVRIVQRQSASADSMLEEGETSNTDSVSGNVDDNEGEAEDSSLGEPAAKASDSKPVVTDMIKGDRFLTTIALEHYGKKKFWVYIYKENEALLGNPDKIAPNTEVVVPAPEKYGIKSGDKESEEAAEKLAAEILAKYQ